MITKLTLTATLTFIVTSCITSHATYDLNKTPIGFEDTYITKGAYTQSNGNFGVLGLEYSAYDPTPPYNDITLINQKFKNQEIVVKTVDDFTSFTYSPIQYWSSGKNVDFFAYSPYRSDLAFKILKNDITIVHEIIGVSSESQVDLLYAIPQKGKNEVVSKNQVIRFPFKHALTKVRISARLYAPNPIPITLIKVELNDIESKANISLIDGSVSIIANSSIPYTYENIDYILSNLDSDSDSDNLPDYYSVGELLMIPQDVSGKIITIQYRFGNGELAEVREKAVTLPANSDWRAGRCVHYKLIIKLDNDIQFSADVEDWPTDDGSEL